MSLSDRGDARATASELYCHHVRSSGGLCSPPGAAVLSINPLDDILAEIREQWWVAATEALLCGFTEAQTTRDIDRR